MKKMLMICIIIMIIIGAYCWFSTYKIVGTSRAVLYINHAQYEIPNKLLTSLLSDLRGSRLYRDTPSCGFDDSYSIEFFNAKGCVISKLLIAQDGCGIFNVANTNLYLEGKDEMRRKINDYIAMLRSE